MFNEKLCVGYQSGFSLIHIYMDEKPQSELPWIHYAELYEYLQLQFIRKFAATNISRVSLREYYKAVLTCVRFFVHTGLVHSDDLTLGFIRLNSLPAMYAVEINNGQEYILCFNSEYICVGGTILIPPAVVGVYVNGQGRRSRKQELLWHSAPVSFGKLASSCQYVQSMVRGLFQLP